MDGCNGPNGMAANVNDCNGGYRWSCYCRGGRMSCVIGWRESVFEGLKSGILQSKSIPFDSSHCQLSIGIGLERIVTFLAKLKSHSAKRIPVSSDITNIGPTHTWDIPNDSSHRELSNDTNIEPIAPTSMKLVFPIDKRGNLTGRNVHIRSGAWTNQRSSIPVRSARKRYHCVPLIKTSTTMWFFCLWQISSRFCIHLSELISPFQLHAKSRLP